MTGLISLNSQAVHHDCFFKLSKLSLLNRVATKATTSCGHKALTFEHCILSRGRLVSDLEADDSSSPQNHINPKVSSRTPNSLDDVESHHRSTITGAYSPLSSSPSSSFVSIDTISPSSSSSIPLRTNSSPNSHR